jgi:integrase
MTKSAAKEKLVEILKPVNAQASPSGDMNLKTFVEKIYLPFYERKWKPSTAASNKDRIMREIVGPLGSRRMDSISRDELQDLLDSRKALSFSTVDHTRWDLRQLFGMAETEGVLARNPAAILFTPRECPRPTRETMTIDQVKLAFGVLELRDRLILKLAILAGMRPGEIFGLRLGGLQENAASISERIYRGEVDTPKTVKSVRLAALSASLRGDLEEWLKVLPAEGPESWLFPSENLLTPLAKDNVMYRSIRPRLKKVGLEWVDYHVARRTHSSLMRDLGVDPKVVSDQQGHTLDVNLNVYTATPLESLLAAVEKLGSAFVN